MQECCLNRSECSCYSNFWGSTRAGLNTEGLTKFGSNRCRIIEHRLWWERAAQVISNVMRHIATAGPRATRLFLFPRTNSLWALYTKQIQVCTSASFCGTPCSSESAWGRPGETGGKQTLNLPPLLFLSFLAYDSTLNMGAKYFSETSGSLRATRRHKPEDRALFSHRREILEYDIFLTIYFMLWWIGKNLVGSGRILTEVLFQHSPGGTEGNH